MQSCLNPRSALPQLCLGTLLLSAAFVLSLGCKDSNDHAGPMPQPTKKAPEGFEVDTGKRIVIAKDGGTATPAKTTPATARPALSEKLLKELTRSLPAIAGLEITDPLEPTPHSRLARMSYCSDRPVEETTAALIKAYKRKKWTDVTMATPSNNKNHRSFSANSARFRMNGTTSQAEFDRCKKSLKKTRVSLSFQERPPASKLDTPLKEHGPKDPPKAKILPRHQMRALPVTTKKNETKSDLK